MKTLRPFVPISYTLCLFVLAAGRAGAATCFVATHGSDPNAGTEAQPWKTLRKAAASVQPGETARIRAGESFKSGWRMVSSHKTP